MEIVKLVTIVKLDLKVHKKQQHLWDIFLKQVQLVLLNVILENIKTAQDKVHVKLEKKEIIVQVLEVNQ